ncbi:MAG: hypothetical protein AAF694_24730 [Bacteroidota bacterium]
MRNLPVFIYLKQTDKFGRPLSIAQFILSYPKGLRDELLYSSEVCYAVTADGKSLTHEELVIHVRKAETSMERQIFDQCFSRDDFAHYVEDYPEGDFVELAKDMIERLDFRGSQTPEEYAQYLRQYPKGKFATQAKQKLRGLKIPAGVKGSQTQASDPANPRQRTYRRASEIYSRSTSPSYAAGSLV